MSRKLSARALSLLFASALACAPPAARTQTAATPAAQDEEVVRVNSALVQTDVTVLDKDGRFVEGLKPGEVELLVDGKPRPVSFFEAVKAGAPDEEAQLAAARGLRAAAARPLDRGRIFLFVVDDLHISPANVQRTRETLTRFVDERLGQNDQAAIFTTTGQLGFLSQLTDDKTVLRLAAGRLVSRWADARETGEQNPISESQAFAIERNDRGVIDYFIDRLTRERCTGPQARARGAGTPRARDASTAGACSAASIERLVIARAKAIAEQATFTARNTLASLENVVRTSEPLPGRKLLFLVSEGFHAGILDSTVVEDMRRVTSLASRVGTVFYSVDARGLRGSTLVREAGERSTFDGENALATTNSGELGDYQAALHQLASETGGRALLDTNDVLPEMGRAVVETSQYYVIAWRPEGETNSGAKLHRIEVRIKGRPELSVRLRRGVATGPVEVANDGREKKEKKEKQKKDAIEEGLTAALKSLYPKQTLPTSVAAGFSDTPGSGPTLTISIEVDSRALGLEGASGPVVLDVAGTIVNGEGKSVSDFEQSLTVTQMEQGAGRRRVIYNQQAVVKPGLYQVRVAARERKGGDAGSAYQWVEVPDLGKAGLMLSSLFIGEVGDGSSQLSVCADRRFARGARSGFLVYVYNAARGSAQPDVALQVQLLRDDQPVVTKPLVKIETEGQPDLVRLPYGESLQLGELPAGRYVLQVTAIDRVAKTSVSRSARFVIE
ncbi:MAG: VWA domain-containing protein [Pyrinomonadaceae bacterium]